MAMYTVSRGAVLVGEVHVLLPSEDTLVAGLLHLVQGEGLRDLTQVTYPFLPGAPTYEHFDDVPRESFTILRKLSAEEANGIGSAQKLELRSAQGELISTKMISIRRSDDSYRAAAEEACVQAGLPITDWEVLASFKFPDMEGWSLNLGSPSTHGT